MKRNAERYSAKITGTTGFLKRPIVGSNPTQTLKVARLKLEGRKVQTIKGSKMNDRKEESPVRRGGECLHESYVSSFLISDLWSFLSGRIHFLTACPEGP